MTSIDTTSPSPIVNTTPATVDQLIAALDKGMHKLELPVSLPFIKNVFNKYPELVNQPLKSGSLPLHHAIKENHKELVEFLISKGASLEDKENEINAFELAIQLQKPEMIEILFKSLVPQHLVEQMESLQASTENPRAAAHLELLEKNHQLLLATTAKYTHTFPGHLLFEFNLDAQTPAADSNLKNVMKIEAVKSNETNAIKLTRLQDALLLGSPTKVERILNAEKHLNNPTSAADKTNNPYLSVVTKDNKNTLLHLTALATQGHWEKMHLLLSQPAEFDLNAQNTNGETVLHLLVANPAVQNPAHLVKWLIDQGANPFIKDSSGFNAFDLMAAKAQRNAHTNDPMIVQTNEWCSLAVASLFWTAVAAQQQNWVANFAWIEPYMPNILGLLGSISNHPTFSLFGTLVGMGIFSAIGWYKNYPARGWFTDPGLNFYLQLITNATQAITTYKTYSACIEHFKHRKWETTKRVVATTLKTAHSLGRLALATYLWKTEAILVEAVPPLPDYNNMFKDNLEAFVT